MFAINPVSQSLNPKNKVVEINRVSQRTIKVVTINVRHQTRFSKFKSQKLLQSTGFLKEELKLLQSMFAIKPVSQSLKPKNQILTINRVSQSLNPKNKVVTINGVSQRKIKIFTINVRHETRFSKSQTKKPNSYNQPSFSKKY